MTIRYRLIPLILGAFLLTSFYMEPVCAQEVPVHSTGQTAKSGSDNKKPTTKSSKTSSKTKKSSTSNKTSSKASSTSKKKSTQSSKKSSSKSKKSSSKVSDKDDSPSAPEFSKADIESYRNMPFETWESPSVTSELGLPMAPGFVQPYPYGHLLRQYDGNKCRHRGLDIGAFGTKYGGIGGVVNSVTHAVVTFIGRTGEDVGEFGKSDMRIGEVTRTGHTFPRQILVPGYGLVYPFSRNYGRWRSGTVIVTKVLDGPLKDHIIRYMHLADVRPDLHVGSEVQAGEHIALMGGTAVMDSHPHVHIDLETPDKKRRDLGPYIGLPGTGVNCGLAEPDFLANSDSNHKKQTSKSSKSSKKSVVKTTTKKQNTKKTSSKSSSSTSKSSKSKNDSKSSKEYTHKKRSSYIGEVETPEEPQTRVLERK